jgi:hypothetical protein
MSLAIKFGDNDDPNQLSGFIYFDVVTKYAKQLSGKVTSHPLDAGANITDHYISENPKFSISGVISSADISGIPSQILIDGETPLNVNPQAGAVVVNDSFTGVLEFASSIGPQFSNSKPEMVAVDSTQRTEYRDQINALITKLMTGLVYNEQEKKLRNRMTLITLYEFVGDILNIESNDLVMTSCTFEEDPDTGSGLYVAMTLEQVSFVTLQKTELPKDVSKSMSKAAQSTSKKSKADGTEKTPGDAASTTTNDPGPRVAGKLEEVRKAEAAKAKLEASKK